MERNRKKGEKGGKEWPCNTPSEDSLKSKTNTITGKTMLRLVKIQSLRKIGLILMKKEIFEFRNFTRKCILVGKHTFLCKISKFKNS
jgi:hypothetical protein